MNLSGPKMSRKHQGPTIRRADRILVVHGGELRESATRAIDARIVELSGKTYPRALFIPTASGDADNYAETFRAQFGDALGCETDTLYLLAKRPAPEVIAEKIQAADLIYVGGGNTLRVNGDHADSVTLTGATFEGQVLLNGHAYDQYELGAATVLVDTSVTVIA